MYESPIIEVKLTPLILGIVLYLLIDCNNFFVSCERLRHRELLHRPVVVLSNNDGCIVAMSNEAKALGLRRGAPLFQMRDLIREQNVAVLSGDHEFYSACSRKVMHVLRRIDPELEVYSVDEAFLHLPAEIGDLAEFGRYIARHVMEKTGIPVSVGIAPTKTLCKIAAGFAKKYPGYRGACVIDNELRRQKALELTRIEDVWGVGRRLSRSFRFQGINTAADFVRLERSRVVKLSGVTGERTWHELRGMSCIENHREATNKSIMSSRTLEREVYTLQELREIICAFIDTISRKLREQQTYALDLEVFIATNRFRTGQLPYTPSASQTLPEATNYTPALAETADLLLKKIFRPGYGYKRAGVCVHNILHKSALQPGLFDDPEQRNKRERLMQVADKLNRTLRGHTALSIAAKGDGLKQHLK